LRLPLILSACDVVPKKNAHRSVSADGHWRGAGSYNSSL